MVTLQKTVIVAEDDPAAVQSLEKLFRSAGFRVMQYKGKETLKQSGYRRGVPCVMLLGDVAGINFYKRLTESNWKIPVIFLHSGNSISEAVQAIQSGAEDYLTKPFCSKALLRSVKRVIAKVEQNLKGSSTDKELLCRASALTERECEIIHLVLSGLLNKQIAEYLGLALVTIKVHRGNAMRKLGARTAAELARIAKDAGIAPRYPTLKENGHTNGFSRHAQVLPR